MTTVGISEAVPEPADRTRRLAGAGLLSRLVDPRLSSEDQMLLDRVKERVEAIENTDLKLQGSRLDFVQYCYGKRLAKYRRARSKWRATTFAGGLTVAFLGAASAVAGALGKGVSAGSGWSVVAIVTGSAVGVIAAVTRALHPEDNFVEFDAAGRGRRSEGWNYVQGLGPYKAEQDEHSRYDLF